MWRVFLKNETVSSRETVLFLKTNNIIGGAVQDETELFQGQQGDIVPFFQGIQVFVIDAGLEKAVLTDPFACHGFPQRRIIDQCNPTFPETKI